MLTPQRALALLSGLVLGPVLTAGFAHAAVDPGSLKGGSIAQTGWWNVANEPPPDNPVAPPPPPPAPDVPAGTLPVSVVAGEVQRISAVEVSLDGATGASVDKLELALRETTQRALAANADGAIIEACPVTESFWVGGENNPWKNRPEHDCEGGKATGVRDAKGVWRFDLTSLASQWLAEDFTGSRSVVLIGAVADETDAPLNFQVVFDGAQTKGIGLLAKTTAPAKSGGTSGDSGDDADGGGTTATPGLGSTGGGLGETSSGGGDIGSLDAGVGAAGADLGAIDAGAAPESAAAATPQVASGQVMPVSAGVAPWYDGVIKPALFLVPVTLGLAYLAMVAMGSTAQPTGMSNRRGVSRALDKLRLAGAGLAAKAGR